MKRMRNQRGFTLAELLVSISLFGAVGFGISSFMVDTMRRTSLENRISLATQEAQNAMQLLIAELRLSSQLSPYLPGTNVALTNCVSSIATTSTSINFIAAHDDTSGVNGLARYMVGYRYDSAKKQLIRGEVSTSSASSCTASGNPTDSSNGATVASNIVQVDADNNGTIDPMFSKSGDLITITLGVEVAISSSFKSTQILSSEVLLRTN